MCRKVIDLRPHHGMCLAYFKGEGYSEGFTGHMGRVLERLEQDALVKLHCGVDEICTACPHQNDGQCTNGDGASQYDEAVLRCCDLQNGDVLSFQTFTERVERTILAAGKRQEICGDCRWNFICQGEQSRWSRG